jgi:cytochrome c-type biogenesis protein CcmH
MMILELWIIFAALIAIACLFLATPWIKAKKSLQAENSKLLMEENVRLFNEQITDLESQKNANRISEADFEVLKLELERNLLQTYQTLKTVKLPAGVNQLTLGYFAIFIIFIVGVFFLYKQLGAGDDLHIIKLQMAKQQSDYQSMLDNKAPDLTKSAEVIGQLEKHLKSDTDNLQYWFLLARLYSEKGDFANAAIAYGEIIKRDQSSGMVMAELAQAMFLRDKHQMNDEIGSLAKKALELEPNNSTALGLLGIFAFSKKDYPGAIKAWQKAVDLLGANTEGGIGLSQGIEKAKSLYLAEGGSSDAMDKSLASKSISLSVAVDPKIKAESNQLVYVYARAWQGSKMPLAITRIPFSQLPTQVTLTEAMAMSPQATLATATQIELVARISHDGSANAKSGDWQTSQGPFDLNELPESISLVIDKQIE